MAYKPLEKAELRNLPHQRFLLFLAVSLLVSICSLFVLPFEKAVIMGFDAGVIAFLASSVGLWMEDHPDNINVEALRDDGGRILLPIVAFIVLVAVLIAVASMIAGKANLDALDFVWVAASLGLSWMFINTVFAFHYAHLYYDSCQRNGVGGLTFPGGKDPNFADFCYFSLVIGMTCQVSDVVIDTHGMRRVGTVHGLLAFFFNLGVLALTINVLSGVL
jgi:uncharacterized membrane protein